MIEEDDASNVQQPRTNRRDRVIKSGSVLLGDSTINCVVRDISPTGARISFATPVVLPTAFSLRIRDGSTYPAVRRWTRGAEIGLEFTAGPSASGDEGHTRRALEALEGLNALTAANWLGILRAERFFGDEALRQAVEAAEIAHEQLKAKLRPHAFTKPPN